MKVNLGIASQNSQDWERLVRGDRRPDSGVARALLGRAVEPRLVAGLAAPRNRVERPEQLSGDDVETADVADHVVCLVRRRERRVRGADDHDVLHDRRRRMRADLVRVPVVALIERLP